MEKLLYLFALVIFFMVLPGGLVYADELTPVITDGSDGNTVTITAEGENEIGAVYIKWDDPVSPYIIQTEYGKISCGKNGFLHEFIILPEKSRSVTILLPEQKMRILQNGIRIFTDETVPEDVQIWQSPCERADIMLISAHSDDEILFMGGIAPTYGAELGARVQVVYMTQFRSTNPVREHEKLDGLWVDGVRNYPVCAELRDVYCNDLEDAREKYDYQTVVDYLTDVIRRFQPQVLVTHDFDGEYGHGFHMLIAAAAAEALENACDDTWKPDSEVFLKYGAWNTPKAYFHLYPEHTIYMNLRIPLESMGGQTALEVAKAAYKQHVSQQKYSFYVSDDYVHSCAKFGLYRTTVGYDEDNNMMEHIVPYDVQEEQEERKRQEQEQKEQEERKRQEQEQKEQEEQEERGHQEQLVEETLHSEKEAVGRGDITIGITAAVLVGLIVCLIRIRRGK